MGLCPLSLLGVACVAPSGNRASPMREKPTVRPETMRRCAKRTSKAMGMETMTTVASMRLLKTGQRSRRRAQE